MKLDTALALLILALPLCACSGPPQPSISLYRAVQVGDLNQIKRHIRWGTDLNQADSEGDLPLHLAARAGQVAIARELAGHGASLDARNAAGQTPLDLALAHGKTKVAELLLRFGGHLDPQERLFDLVAKGVSDRDVFDFLIRRGADTNRPNPQGEPPLHLAIRLGHLETVRRLLQRGADVNRPDDSGLTPLALAQGLGPTPGSTKDIMATLRQYGARLPEPLPTTDSDPKASQTGDTP